MLRRVDMTRVRGPRFSVMPWLVAGDRVVASLEIAHTRRQRRRGLLGRDEIEGAMLIDPARSVHTIGMRFPIDVAHCDRELRVLRVTSMTRRRVAMPVPRARLVIEAEKGSFERWGIEPGIELEIR